MSGGAKGSIVTTAPLRLPLIGPSDELSGVAPREYERLVRGATRGDRAHVAAVGVAYSLASRAAFRALPPSSRAQLDVGFDALRRWLTAKESERQAASQNARAARGACYSAQKRVESTCRDAILRAMKSDARVAPSEIDEHADRVVLRYVGLGAHHALAALCHALDGVESPSALLEVPRDSAGAIAYLAVGLGSARHRPFREAAIQEARWQHEGTVEGQTGDWSLGAFALQLFHEYLGARWAKHEALARDENEAFLRWAIGS